jgi:hypothetical protein
MKYFDDLCLKCLLNAKMSQNTAIGWMDFVGTFFYLYASVRGIDLLGDVKRLSKPAS